MRLSRLFALSLLCTPIAPAFAHEFWIEPLSFQVVPGERLQAHFKNGEEFAGNDLAFFDRSSDRFDLITASRAQALTPRSGDRPALDVPASAEGLVTVVHETAPALITYRDWAKFEKFIAHKDFTQAAATHLANGWTQEKFRERYTRHVKALMAVGNGAGADRNTGMVTEFIALTNPYSAIFNHQMRIELLYDGAPRSDAQVEVFGRNPAGDVTISLHRTDAMGVAEIPVQPGFDYLFDAVVLRPAAPTDSAGANPVVWETLWAALTFAVPAR